jgi:hypothetical protein
MDGRALRVRLGLERECSNALVRIRENFIPAFREINIFNSDK